MPAESGREFDHIKSGINVVAEDEHACFFGSFLLRSEGCGGVGAASTATTVEVVPGRFGEPTTVIPNLAFKSTFSWCNKRSKAEIGVVIESEKNAETFYGYLAAIIVDEDDVGAVIAVFAEIEDEIDQAKSKASSSSSSSNSPVRFILGDNSS